MIRFEGVKKTFKDHNVVKDLNFEIATGETFCLLGRSGSGKTTTLKMINKLIDSNQGSIFIDNQNIQDVDDISLRRSIGYIIQNVGLFPHMTVEENIAVPLKLQKWDKEQIHNRLQELMDQIGLETSFLKRYPHQLSGGQQQRIGIARAIATKPKILLMDEPFSALDPILRDQMQEDFLQMSELQGMTKVVVTHDIKEAIKLGDRICILEEGVIHFLGTRSELIQSESTLIKGFLGENLHSLKLNFQSIGSILKSIDTEKDCDEEMTSTISQEAKIVDLLNLNGKCIRILETEQVYNKAELLLTALSPN